MRADARRNREQLLAAARAAFDQHGADASLDDIARRAGVGSGTLYRHFPSRDALLEAVVGDAFARLQRQADELLDASGSRQALVAWLRAVVAYTMTIRGLAGTLMASQDDESSALQRPCQLIANTTVTLLDRAKTAGVVRPDVEPEDLGRLAFGIAVAAEADPERRELADRLLRLALDGLDPRSSSPPAYP